MSGIDRHTGAPITDVAHLAQSVGVLLNTPVGSRVLRRDYGSDLPRLLDAPINGTTVVDLYVAAAEAIDLWEPRLDLRRVAVADAGPGRLCLDVEVGASDLSTDNLRVEVVA